LLVSGKGDLIFMVASDSDARRLWRPLDVANGRRLPVLATSHVYGGNRADASALAGLYFVDIPWLIGAVGPSRTLPMPGSGTGSVNTTLLRLSAMGIDSYRLAPRARAMHRHPGHFFPGVSGGLSIDGSGRVVRSLSLGRFEATGPVAVARIEHARPAPASSPSSAPAPSQAVRAPNPAPLLAQG
jgi:outer membrane PBP1 activator LpoA protein